MHFSKNIIMVVVLLLVVQMQPHACCDIINIFNMDITRIAHGEDSAVIVNVNNITLPENTSPFADTLYPSQLFSKLKIAYDTSKLVVVAHVSECTRTYPPLETSGEWKCQTETATVVIDTILKGTMLQQQKIISNVIEGDARFLSYDSSRNVYDTHYVEISIKEPGYQFIKGKRFLVFAQDVNQCFELPLVPVCASVTDAYVIDTDNQIYFDGTNVDLVNRKVTDIADIKLSYSYFINNLRTVQVIRKNNVPLLRNLTGISVSVFDVLGKKVSNVDVNSYSAHHQSSLLLIKNDKNPGLKRMFINRN